MAEKKEITVRATQREGRGKNDARRARRDGQVPVTIYGGEGETVAALAPLARAGGDPAIGSGRNTIFTIDIEGVGASEVMFHDRQIDPVRGRLVHADFKRLVKGEKIEVTVPLRLVGEPIGVREEQGVLEQIIREIEIRCDPRDIPEAIDVDVTNLGCPRRAARLGYSDRSGIEILTAADTVIATVGVVKEEAVAPRRPKVKAG